MQEGHELQFHLSAEQRSSFAAQLVTDFDKIETAIAQIDARDAEASFPQVLLVGASLTRWIMYHSS